MVDSIVLEPKHVTPMPKSIPKQISTREWTPDDKGKPVENIPQTEYNKPQTGLVSSTDERHRVPPPHPPPKNRNDVTKAMKYHVSRNSYYRSLASRVPSIKPNNNITANASGEMDFSLQIKLDSNHESCILQLAIGTNWAFEEISCDADSLLVLGSMFWDWYTVRTNGAICCARETRHGEVCALAAQEWHLGCFVCACSLLVDADEYWVTDGKGLDYLRGSHSVWFRSWVFGRKFRRSFWKMIWRKLVWMLCCCLSLWNCWGRGWSLKGRYLAPLYTSVPFEISASSIY